MPLGRRKEGKPKRGNRVRVESTRKGDKKCTTRKLQRQKKPIGKGCVMVKFLG